MRTILLLLLFTAVARAEPTRFAPGVVSIGTDDAHATFTADGKTVYFVRSTPDFGHWTILVSRLARGRWTQPVVAPFSGRWRDADVFFTRDGGRLYFISNRPTEAGGAARPDTEIWVMTRAGKGWGPPRHVAELGSPGDEWFPSLTDDGTIYFGSERPGGRGKSDLWRARAEGDHFAAPENLGEVINTADQEIEAHVAPDERYIVFAARGRAEGKGAYDLFVSQRCQGRFTAPRALPVNSTGWEFGPRIHGDRLFFTSTRSDFEAPLAKALDYRALMKKLDAPGNGLRDIYQVDVAGIGLDKACP